MNEWAVCMHLRAAMVLGKVKKWVEHGAKLGR